MSQLIVAKHQNPVLFIRENKCPPQSLGFTWDSQGPEGHSVSIQVPNKDQSVYLLWNILAEFGFLSYESSTTDVYLNSLIFKLWREGDRRNNPHLCTRVYTAVLEAHGQRSSLDNIEIELSSVPFPEEWESGSGCISLPWHFLSM